jgi:hypothetical protein
VRYRFIHLVVLSLLFSAGCASHLPPNAAVETKIAAYASDAMKGVREIQRLTVALEAGGIIKTADAAQVMIVADKVGQNGERLAYLLAMYHSASGLSANSALAEVIAVLDEMEANLKLLLAPLDKTGQKTRYVQTVIATVKALWSIRSALPGGA